MRTAVSGGGRTTPSALCVCGANWAFDHVEKHDDRVLAYANYLSPGTHELSYLVRAVTSGTFSASGATLEAMYAPEWSGRSASTTVRIR